MRIPALLAILDGVGLAPPSASNAVSQADAPFLQELFSDTTWPCRQLEASGRAVGLPDGQMGNSEVGHLNIGAGRVVNQELTRIDLAIEHDELKNNPVLQAACQTARDQKSRLHLIGLLSDGGVHSELRHLEALIALAATSGVQDIALQLFLDGRDVPPTSGRGFVQQISDFLGVQRTEHTGLSARIASLAGRYWAMDRDQRWSRIQRSWQVIVQPSADPSQLFSDGDAVALVQAAYDAGTTDEFLAPLALDGRGVLDGDVLIFFNFRPDRARELTRALLDPDFTGFLRPVFPKIQMVCLTEYDAEFADMGAWIAFSKEFPSNVLADYLANLGLRQLHIAETEKYAHVTFFFNGGVEAAKPREQRILIPSPQVATYDLQPEMSAPAVTAALVSAIQNDAADVYILNYANGDMVGHTGIESAAEQAVAAVDRGLRQVVQAILAAGGVALVTADHGNAEVMQDATGQAWTAHSLSPVPLVVISADSQGQQRQVDLDRQGPGCLADIAPTLLDLMELPSPAEFSGRSLLRRS